MLQALAQSNSPQFWTEIYRKGKRYVTYETNYATFHAHFGTLPSMQGVPPWLHVTQITSSADGLERIYQVDGVNPPLQPTSICAKDSAGIWQVSLSDAAAQP